jgi:hypothetical protein
MDDSQSPPDAEPRDGSHKDEAAHRASEEPGRPATAIEPAGWPSTAPETTDASDSADPPEAPPESAQSLDAFIDSLPAGPPSPVDAQSARQPLAEAGFPLIPPMRYNRVSNIFDGLDSQRPPAEAAQTGEAAPGGTGLGKASSLVATDLDGDAAPPPGPNGADASAEPAREPTRSDAASSLSAPLIYQPAAASAPMPEPSDWPPDATGAPPGDDAPPPPLAESSELPPPAAASAPADGATPAAPAVAETATETAGGEGGGDSEEQPHAPQSASDGGADPFPEPLGWPPFMEPPGAGPADPDVEPLKPPSLVTNPEPVNAVSPFPGPPAWPPYMDPPGSDPEVSTSAPSGLPPYIELSVHSDPEEAATAEPTHLDDPPRPGAVRGDMPAFDEPPPAPAPRDAPRFHTVEPTAPPVEAAPRTTAASAKIAAEANATAQALDNLQRLLSKAVPPAPTPSPAIASPLPPEPQMYRSQHPPQRPHFQMPQDNPFAPDMPPPMLPLPMRHTDDASDRRVYVLGFLTGLVLSMVAGLALYFLINFG